MGSSKHTGTSSCGCAARDRPGGASQGEGASPGDSWIFISCISFVISVSLILVINVDFRSWIFAWSILVSYIFDATISALEVGLRLAGSDTDQQQIDFSFLVEHWWASDGWIEVWSIPVFWISILLKSVGAQRTACRHRRSWSSLSLLDFSFVDVSLWNPLFCDIYQMRLVRSPASQPGKFARFT